MVKIVLMIIYCCFFFGFKFGFLDFKRFYMFFVELVDFFMEKLCYKVSFFEVFSI